LVGQGRYRGKTLLGISGDRANVRTTSGAHRQKTEKKLSLGGGRGGGAKRQKKGVWEFNCWPEGGEPDVNLAKTRRHNGREYRKAESAQKKKIKNGELKREKRL